jgi:acetyl-CoA/propionyl-CoA carboxylase, biotin carboxylase, biotin carboxyl carrier protein
VRVSLVDEDGHESVVTVHGRSSDATVVVDDGPSTSAALERSGDRIAVTLDGVARPLAAAVDAVGPEPVVWIGEAGDAWAYRVPQRHRIHRPDEPDSDGGDLRSPMPGSVVVVAKQAGDLVAEGEVVVVVEAMKMEYPLVSPVAGTVAQVGVDVGSQVVRDQVVAVVVPVG